jgi:hypothetical protein
MHLCPVFAVHGLAEEKNIAGHAAGEGLQEQSLRNKWFFSFNAGLVPS